MFANIHFNAQSLFDVKPTDNKIDCSPILFITLYKSLANILENLFMKPFYPPYFVFAGLRICERMSLFCSRIRKLPRSLPVVTIARLILAVLLSTTSIYKAFAVSGFTDINDVRYVNSVFRIKLEIYEDLVYRLSHLKWNWLFWVYSG